MDPREIIHTVQLTKGVALPPISSAINPAVWGGGGSDVAILKAMVVSASELASSHVTMVTTGIQWMRENPNFLLFFPPSSLILLLSILYSDSPDYMALPGRLTLPPLSSSSVACWSEVCSDITPHCWSICFVCVHAHRVQLYSVQLYATQGSVVHLPSQRLCDSTLTPSAWGTISVCIIL